MGHASHITKSGAVNKTILPTIYKSKTNNTDIASLYITSDWDTHPRDQANRTHRGAGYYNRPRRNSRGAHKLLFTPLLQEKHATENTTFLDLLYKRGITHTHKDSIEKDI